MIQQEHIGIGMGCLVKQEYQTLIEVMLGVMQPMKTYLHPPLSSQ